jgi:hypothetical protein
LFENLTYQKKNKLLAGVLVLALILAYFLAIQNTIYAYKSYKENEEKVANANTAPQKVAYYKKKLADIENIIKKQQGTGMDNQQLLLSVVSDYCNENDLVLKEFPLPITSNDKDYTIETNIFEIQGGFIKLVKLVYELEQNTIVGKVMSVNYEIKKNYKTKSFALTATLYLQNIKKNK